jgi:microcystin degradation protein MlrC
MPVMQRIPRHYRIWSEDGRLLAREEVPAIRAMRGATVRDELVKVQSGSDAPRWLRIGASPLRLGGAQVGVVATMTDITERKRAEEDLKVVTRLYAVLSRVNEAIVRIGEVVAILAEGPTAFTDARQFEPCGIDPLSVKIVVVKEGYLFPGLSRIAPRYIMLLTPGASDMRIERLAYVRRPKPAFPFEPETTFNPDAAP